MESLYSDLKARGILYQVTDESLSAHLGKAPVTLYCGFDPTSDSLHVGSLFPLLTLRRFQLAGHRPIIVLGGATGMVGDPSGKSQERNLQTPEQVDRNLAGIRKVAERFLDFSPSAKAPARMVNNADFYRDMNVLTFLREVGKHFTVNHMTQKDSVRSRMEDRDHGISYTEFSYMLLQAYDFFCLHEQFGCTLQIGASDQWGNITAGTELIRKKLAHSDEVKDDRPLPAFGLTHPLITRPDGVKFGKTEQGAVWLSAEKTSPYRFYQFFIQSPDAVVGTWLRFLTFLPLSEIERLEEKVRTEPEKKEAQISLARELTRLVHGDTALQKAEAATQALFGVGIKELDLETLNDLFSDAPSHSMEIVRLSSGLPLVDLLAESGLFQSKGAARKEIPAGGVYLNNERVTDPAFAIKPEHLIGGSTLILRKGKKNYQLVRFT
jgi:tyrosyl-tRNA synthetase